MSRHHRSDAAWQRFRRRLLEDRGHRCEGCRKIGGRLELHHVLPLARGGTDDPGNLKVLCRSCHIAHHRRSRPQPPGRAEWVKLRDALR